MGSPLLTYARRLTIKPNEPLVRVPVLVWSAAAENKATKQFDLTMARAAVNRPAAGEVLVYEVLKKPNQGANPFTMGVTIGRTESNDIPLEDGSVSRFHAYLREQSPGNWELVDAESKNGSWVGALRVGANKPTPVLDGTLLRFGDVRVQFLLPASFVKYIEKAM